MPVKSLSTKLAKTLSYLIAVVIVFSVETEAERLNAAEVLNAFRKLAVNIVKRITSRKRA